MPDFGLSEALEAAMKAAKETPVMRPAEQKLAAQAAKAAPQAAAPVTPAVSAAAPPAEAPPGAVTAPKLNPSAPPQEAPLADPAAAPADPAAAPAAPETAAATPPPPAGVAAQNAPVEETPAPTVRPGEIAPANRVTVPPEAPPAPAGPTPVQETAQRFVSANIGDFKGLDMAHIPNLDVMTSPDEVKAAIARVADDNKAAITAAKGGTVPDEQLIGLAQDLSLNSDVVQQVMEREFGQAAVQRNAFTLAARMVEQNQAGTLFALSDRILSGSATAQEEIDFERAMQQFEAYRVQLSGASAEWGRQGRALASPVGLDPAVAGHIADIIRRNNPDRLATATAIKLAGTPQGIANIISGMANLPLARRIGAAGWGLVQRVFINGILSGPGTWFRILQGNNLNVLVNQGDLFVAGMYHELAGFAARIGRYPTPQEGITWNDAIAHMHGVFSGSSDAFRVAGRVMRTGQSMDSIMGQRTSESLSGAGRMQTNQIIPEINGTVFGSVVHAIDNVIDAPGSRVIAGVDDFTKTLGYRAWVQMKALKEVSSRAASGSLRPGDPEAIVRDMMTNTSPELQQEAELWAHRMTFQTPFGPMGQTVQKAINVVPGARFVFPFMRTATNIFKQGMTERTPLALLSARIRSEVAAGGASRELALARLTTGTLYGSMLAAMATHDRITGAAPKDAKTRLAWEADGRTPYSIRITNPITGKDTWHSYMNWEPLASTAGLVADIVKLHSYIAGYDDGPSMMPQEDHLSDAAAHVVGSIITNTGDKTFMQGAAQFSEMYNDPQRAFSMWADQMGANLQPFSGLTKFARNEQDPFLRHAYTLVDKVRNQLPTMPGVEGSKTLMPVLDIFGQERTTTSGNSILGPLSPFPSSPAKDDIVSNELKGLMDQTKQVPISMPTPRLAYLGAVKGMQEGTGMKLTPDEYFEYVKIARDRAIFDGGKLNFREKLEQTIRTPVYQLASATDRVNLLSNVAHQADHAAAGILYKDNAEFRARMQQWKAQADAERKTPTNF